MFFFVRWNPATVAFDRDLFTFSKETYDDFYNSTHGWTA